MHRLPHLLGDLQAGLDQPAGTEYVWFNNVETRPGQGYPRTYEDQDRWRGGWIRDRRGRLRLRDGGRLHKLSRIFANPKLPSIDDYYEPWTYDYENLTSAPLGEHMPVAPPRSLISGKPMKVSWSANWDDDLGGSPEILPGDPILKKVSEQVRLELEQTFMFYLPRICEHCLNPSCVASCPSGAMYKRTEDGIVLVDQDRCRGWRMCVSGCPYKKVYFNHKTGKAEKCTLCYPRIEVGPAHGVFGDLCGTAALPGLVLYDVDRVLEAASVENDTDLYEAQRQILLDPTDPEVIAGARAEGISDEWIEAAQRSPVYALINTYRVALPLHPEFRTMPMVWYIPPLSPVVDAVSRDGHDGEELGNLFGALEALRIPIQYLAELFTAGDTAVVEGVLRRLAAMRSYMRDINLGRETQPHIPQAVGMSEEQMYQMYRLLALAKYEERYVIPTAYAAEGAGVGGDRLLVVVRRRAGHVRVGPLRRGQRRTGAVAVETFHALQQRQTTEGMAANADHPSRVNLLNWDGRGVPTGLFPGQEDASMKLRTANRPPTLADRLVWQSASYCWPTPTSSATIGSTPSTNCWLMSTTRRRTAGRAVAALRRTDLLSAAIDYVDTFDLRRRSTMYLTYWTAGDTRNRGNAMHAFASAYRNAGVEPPTEEAADHLPVVLEFAATVDPEAGRRLLIEHRVPIDVLRQALDEADSPYAHAVAAVCETLPAGTDRGTTAGAAAGAGRSATEAVGLQPFTLTVPPRRAEGGR